MTPPPRPPASVTITLGVMASGISALRRQRQNIQVCLYLYPGLYESLLNKGFGEKGRKEGRREGEREGEREGGREGRRPDGRTD